MDLFNQSAISKTKRPEFLGITARRKLSLPENHTCSGWERVHGGLLVTIQEEYLKRNGQTSWQGIEYKCFISYDEIEAERKGWEISTGKCSTCGGDGIHNYGWSREEGVLSRQCQPCGGTGNAQLAQ